MTETFEYYFNKYKHTGSNRIPIENGVIIVLPHYITFCSYFDSHTYEMIAYRIDGPARFYKTGRKDWVINGKWQAVRHEKWYGPFYEWTVEQGMDIDNLTEEDVSLIKIIWG